MHDLFLWGIGVASPGSPYYLRGCVSVLGETQRERQRERERERERVCVCVCVCVKDSPGDMTPWSESCSKTSVYVSVCILD